MIKKCKICGKEFEAKNNSQMYCSPRHDMPCPVCGKIQKNRLNRQKDVQCKECAKKQIKKTNLERYGGHPMKNEKIKESAKKTWENKTDEELKDIQEKRKKTNLERYGAESPLESKEIQEKIKQTNLEKYGVENFAQTEDFKNLIQEHWNSLTDEERSKIEEKKKKTMLEKYGVENYSYTDDFKETIRAIWGSKTKEEIDEIRQKVEKTNLKKYGERYFHLTDLWQPLMRDIWDSKTDEELKGIREKIEKTNLERYGVKDPNQLTEIKEKKRKTSLERYGVDHPSKSEEIKSKIRKTNLEKYGVEHYALTDTFSDLMKDYWSTLTEEEKEERLEKTKNTNLKRYGLESYSQTEEYKSTMKDFWNSLTEEERNEIKNKRQNTNIERYGYKEVFESPDIQEKIKQTNLKKYGVSNPMQSETIKEKVSGRTRSLYGVNNISHKNINHYAEYIDLENTLSKNYQNTDYWCRYFKINRKHFRKNIRKRGLQSLIKDFYSLSQLEEDFINDMADAGIDDSLYIMHDRATIKPLELDFYFPNHNLAVEISPTFTHCYINETSNYSLGTSNKFYHYEKFKACKEKGIELITVFDWSDTGKIIDFIKDKIRQEQKIVYARKTEYKEVDELDRDNKDFLDSNHILGSINNRQGTFVGELYYKDKKVGIAVFTPLNKHQIELRRLVFNKRYKVIGGASKLLKNALKGKDYKEVITFSDNDLGTGNVYEVLGFDVLVENKGTLIWYNELLDKKIPNLSLVKQGADRLLKNIPGYEFVGQGENLPSNQEIIASYGFLPVYDAGYTKWIKRIN